MTQTAGPLLPGQPSIELRLSSETGYPPNRRTGRNPTCANDAGDAAARIIDEGGGLWPRYRKMSAQNDLGHLIERLADLPALDRLLDRLDGSQDYLGKHGDRPRQPRKH